MKLTYTHLWNLRAAKAMQSGSGSWNAYPLSLIGLTTKTPNWLRSAIGMEVDDAKYEEALRDKDVNFAMRKTKWKQEQIEINRANRRKFKEEQRRQKEAFKRLTPLEQGYRSSWHKRGINNMNNKILAKVKKLNNSMPVNQGKYWYMTEAEAAQFLGIAQSKLVKIARIWARSFENTYNPGQDWKIDWLETLLEDKTEYHLDLLMCQDQYSEQNKLPMVSFPELQKRLLAMGGIAEQWDEYYRDRNGEDDSELESIDVNGNTREDNEEEVTRDLLWLCEWWLNCLKFKSQDYADPFYFELLDIEFSFEGTTLADWIKFVRSCNFPIAFKFR